MIGKKNDPIEIKERIKKAEIEMKTEADFDTVIINEDLDVAKQELIDKVGEIPKMKVGLFFGTFDPLHIGHDQIASYF